MAADVGQAAPDFNLYDFDRQQRKLSDLRGQNVVLAFFPGAFTGVCTTEMCTFRDRGDAFNAVNAQVFGISADPPFALKAWADQNNLNFTLLSDFNREAINAYGVPPAEPGRSGRLRCLPAGSIRDRQGRGSSASSGWEKPR